MMARVSHRSQLQVGQLEIVEICCLINFEALDFIHKSHEMAATRRKSALIAFTREHCSQHSNLGWKIASVLNGTVNRSILKTYRKQALLKSNSSCPKTASN